MDNEPKRIHAQLENMHKKFHKNKFKLKGIIKDRKEYHPLIVKRWMFAKERSSTPKKSLYNLSFYANTFRDYLTGNYNLIGINFKSHNVFCYIKDVKKKKVIKNVWSGLYKLKIGSKTLKRLGLLVIKKFLNVLYFKRAKNVKPVVFKIIAPRRIRKKVIVIVSEYLQKIGINKFCNILIDVPNKKVFNGCRAPKQIRKKRKRKNYQLLKIS